MKRVLELFRKWFRSYRKKFKLYFFVTFLVPIFIILIINIITLQMLREQVIDSGKKTMAQFFAVMESRLIMFADDAFNIVDNQECLEYAALMNQDPEQHAHLKYTLLDDELKDLTQRTYATSYEDVMLWFACDDNIISFRRLDQQIDSFCRMNYSDDEAFVKAFSEHIKRTTYAPNFWVLEDGDEEDGEKFLFMSLKQGQRKRDEYNYVVVFEMNIDRILEVLGEGVLNAQNENFAFFNPSGELLFSYQDGGLERLDRKHQQNGIYEIEQDGKKYTIFVEKSDVTKGYYVMQFSHEVFYQNQIKVMSVSMFGIFLSIIVGFIVILKFSRSSYRPIESVLNELQNRMNCNYDAYAYNEYEFILESLKSIESGQQKRANTLETDDVVRKKELLRAVLEGRSILEEEIEFLKKKEILQEDRKYFVGLIYLQNCGTVGWDLLSFVIVNVFEELSDEIGKGYVISFSAAYHVIVIRNDLDAAEAEVAALLQKGQKYLQQYSQISIQLGCSNICQDFQGLRNAYQEAQTAYEYNFLLSGEQMVRYSEISERQYAAPIVFDGSTYNRLKDYLENEDRTETTEEFIDQLFETYGIEKSASIALVEVFRIEILNALGILFISNEVNVIQRRFYMELLLDAKTLEGYKDQLVRVIKELDGNVQKDNRKKFLTRHIKKYVEEHYTDPNVSVATIGSVFGMQAAYLSRMFKDEYGVLLLDFIIERRISHSKKLLKESNLTINEIAGQSGFLSGSVFIRTFKRVTGITPGKYRLDMDMQND